MIRHRAGAWYHDPDTLRPFVREDVDIEQAICEGWTLSSDGYNKPQLIVIGDPHGNDEDAWTHVADEAARGSAYHRSILAYLLVRNRTEFNAIRDFYCDVLDERRQLNRMEQYG